MKTNPTMENTGLTSIQTMNKLDGYDPTMDIETLDEYQFLATGTAIYPGTGEPLGLAYVALKCNGEAGEFAEHVGKAMRDEMFGQSVYRIYEDTYEDVGLSSERRALIKKELGDILWYVSAGANEIGYSLSEIANENLQKLYSRKERGVLGGSGDLR